MNKPADSLLWAQRAWLPGGWQDKVLLRIGADGRWAEIVPGVPTPPQGAEQLGTVLPGLVDAHSHAFQRAFAGLAEQRTSAADTFWSWRDRMYRVALRITPEQLRAIAAQLYIELLQGGYTQVCEFHYLQHAPDGQPYADPLAFSWALADAARDVGIGLTLLPVLYERAGFQQPALRPDQRRFATTPKACGRRCKPSGADANRGWTRASPFIPCARRRPLPFKHWCKGQTASTAPSTSTLPSKPPRWTTASPQPASAPSPG